MILSKSLLLHLVKVKTRVPIVVDSRTGIKMLKVYTLVDTKELIIFLELLSLIKLYRKFFQLDIIKVVCLW